MSNLIGNTQANVKSEFDAACVDVYGSSMRRSLLGAPGQDLLPRFAQSYQHLLALPRRMRRSLQRQWKRTLGGVALLLALTPGASFAATMNVAAGVAPDVNADGKCSLNEAVFNANNDRAMYPDCPAGSGKDTIILPVGSKQVLTNSVGPLPGSDYAAQGVPKIRSAIIIEGRGSTIERADGSPIDVMMVVETNGDLTLNETIISGRPATASPSNNGVLCIFNRGKLLMSKGSILRGSFQREPRRNGGGLRNEGSATLLSSTIANNESYGSGGGISSRATATTLLISDSVVIDNYAANEGGGIHNTRSSMTVRNSTIARNSARDGGGIFNIDATATIENSMVSNNLAGEFEHGFGGGVVNWSGGNLTLVNSMISGNTAGSPDAATCSAGIGGGIATVGTANIVRSTIADNSAKGAYSEECFYAYYGYGGGVLAGGSTTLSNSTISGNWANGRGGGLEVSGGTLVLTHSTVTANSALLVPGYPFSSFIEGGGIVVGTATVRIERSLVSGNRSEGTSPEVGKVSGKTGTIVANNFNLFGASGKSGVQGFTPGPTDIVPTVPVSSIVMPIANNGGKGATHALAINSPALNAAPIDPKCPATDQRGNPRPQGVKCDIGSFEGSAVLCNGLVTTQVGTNLADSLTGTAGRDVIAGLAGNDTIRGLNGNDVICAGSGADKVYGGNNNDLLFGDSENDQLFGDAGNDALNGGTGTDKCNGGTGTDTATQCETRTSVP